MSIDTFGIDHGSWKSNKVAPQRTPTRFKHKMRELTIKLLLRML
jgi:hypothetical protein